MKGWLTSEGIQAGSDWRDEGSSQRSVTMSNLGLQSCLFWLTALGAACAGLQRSMVERVKCSGVDGTGFSEGV